MRFLHFKNMGEQKNKNRSKSERDSPGYTIYSKINVQGQFRSLGITTNPNPNPNNPLIKGIFASIMNFNPSQSYVLGF